MDNTNILEQKSIVKFKITGLLFALLVSYGLIISNILNPAIGIICLSLVGILFILTINDYEKLYMNHVKSIVKGLFVKAYDDDLKKELQMIADIDRSNITSDRILSKKEFKQIQKYEKIKSRELDLLYKDFCQKEFIENNKDIKKISNLFIAINISLIIIIYVFHIM